ncbi:MAG: hypothetical protein CM1200mP31_0740 [Candidatus Neomarinimicrobiota bacterium]|nr:MAG: hypothetical protein CM1200mP31_0740 [Candidatus Neomarinimicrobiota bacterium]
MFFFLYKTAFLKGVASISSTTGVFYALLILICGLVYGAYLSIKNEKTVLAIISTSILLLMIGYSTYFTIFIRSSQNPAIDENNPETIEEAISYLNRDQYGAVSFLPRKFDDLPSKIAVVGKPEYKNLEFSNKQNYDYATYKLSDQMIFLWSYQISKMYLRYFLWQFAGKGSTDDPVFVASAKTSIPGGLVSPFWGASKKQDGVDWSQFGLPLALIVGLYGLYFHFVRINMMHFRF